MILKDLIEQQNVKSLWWYPSAGLDIQIIEKIEFNLDMINHPQMYVFSDVMYHIGTEGILNFNHLFGYTNDWYGFELVRTYGRIDNLTIYENFYEHFPNPALDKKVNDAYDLWDKERRQNADETTKLVLELDFLFPDTDGDQKKAELRSALIKESESDFKQAALYKRNNVFILFIATYNQDIFNSMGNELFSDGLIYNRTYDTPFWPLGENNDWVNDISKLPVKHVCFGSVGADHNHTFTTNQNYRLNSKRFKWRDSSECNDYGDLLELV